MKKILLCPPTYYDIKYEINPWMDIDNPVDRSLAQEQYERLKQTYNLLHVPYDELLPNKDVPDQVFTTDTGHAEGNIFIRANFKYDERKKEAEIAEHYFKTKGYSIHTLPEGIYFEGGDLLKFEDTYILGWGKRTSKEAKAYIEKNLDVEIISLELPDEAFYHLDTCVAPITKDVVIANMEALTSEGIKSLKHHFNTIIPTTKEDNELLACNLMNIDGKAVLTQGISSTLQAELRPYVDLINTVPMSEYIKGGGSVHCVSLEIFD
ncbi:MAG: arginine deiminase family protein [bacterium]|nr:arginine deiminase family protein [bacterium]